MLTVLGGLAEFERHLILARTSEGRQRAQQRGVRFGRKPSLTEHQRQEALARRATGEALVDIARSYPQSSALLQNAGIAPRPQSAALRGVAGEVPVYEIP
jgi:DNA invertase Pin-like site-specific DNA recombinase